MSRKQPEVPTCRECGCTDDDCSGCVERTGAPCSWVESDLCSACCDTIIGATPGALSLDPLDESDPLRPLLEWVAAFSCQRGEQLVAGTPPCAGDTADPCAPCAAAALLGRGDKRFVENAREHRRLVRAVRGLRRASRA